MKVFASVFVLTSPDFIDEAVLSVIKTQLRARLEREGADLSTFELVGPRFYGGDENAEYVGGLPRWEYVGIADAPGRNDRN